MRLAVRYSNARNRHIADVIDERDGRSVGYIRAGSVHCGGMYVFLFEGKYAARCMSYDECLGFVKGVQAVLNFRVAADSHQDLARGAA